MSGRECGNRERRARLIRPVDIGRSFLGSVMHIASSMASEKGSLVDLRTAGWRGSAEGSGVSRGVDGLEGFDGSKEGDILVGGGRRFQIFCLES
jgi:hypothetical protein